MESRITQNNFNYNFKAILFPPRSLVYEFSSDNLQQLRLINESQQYASLNLVCIYNLSDEDYSNYLDNMIAACPLHTLMIQNVSHLVIEKLFYRLSQSSTRLVKLGLNSLSNEAFEIIYSHIVTANSFISTPIEVLCGSGMFPWQEKFNSLRNRTTLSREMHKLVNIYYTNNLALRKSNNDLSNANNLLNSRLTISLEKEKAQQVELQTTNASLQEVQNKLRAVETELQETKQSLLNKQNELTALEGQLKDSRTAYSIAVGSFRELKESGLFSAETSEPRAFI